MKKAVLTAAIIIINIVLSIAAVIAADYCFAKYDWTKQILLHNKVVDETSGSSEEEKAKCRINLNDFNYVLKLIDFGSSYNAYKDFFLLERFKIKPPLNNIKPDKKSILILGCSFAYGASLEDNETIGYQLSKLTGRTVYNRGIGGFGISEMLYQTKQADFYDSIDVPLEYAFYVFIHDHIRRILLMKYVSDVYLNYEEEEGALIEKYPPFGILRCLYSFRILMEKHIYNKWLNNESRKDELFDLMKRYFEEMRRALQARYPDIKFVIIKYPLLEHNAVSKYIESSERWKELEDEGFIIYDISKEFNVNFNDSEYRLPDGHPKANAWEIVSRQLVRDLGL